MRQHKAYRSAEPLPNGKLSLFFGSDEKDFAAVLSCLTDKIISFLKLFYRLLKIDNVDAVSLGENVFSHFQVPTAGLMSEMDTCFEKLFHGYYAHFYFLLVFTAIFLILPKTASGNLHGNRKM